jgi:hypothetical protein
LTVGRVYAIAGMYLRGTELKFLVRDDSRRPAFAAAGLFDLFESEIPIGWVFGLNSGLVLYAPEGPSEDLRTHRRADESIRATWGYRELITDLMHVTALFDLDGDAGAQANAAFDRAIAESSGLESPLRALLEEVTPGVPWDKARAVDEDLDHIRFGDALVRLAWMVADHLVLITPADFEFIMSAADELRCEKDLPLGLGELVTDG